MDRQHNLRSIDLNLIPVLRELIRTRSVSQAAKNLQMGQPHVSEALQKLRHIFNDEVLVRVGQTMVPTLYMLEIAPMIENFIVETANLSNKASMPIASGERQFVIAAPDIVIAAIAPMLEALVIAKDSNMTVRFMDFRIQANRTTRITPEPPLLTDLTWADAHRFESGSIDMVIAPDPVLSQLPYQRSELFSDDLVYIAHNSNKIASASSNMEYIYNRRSIACRTDFKNLRAESPIGNGKVDMVGIAQTLLLPFFISDTDMIALVTRRTEKFFSKTLDINVIYDDKELPTISFFLHWLKINEHDTQHSWLRTQIHEISKEL